MKFYKLYIILPAIIFTVVSCKKWVFVEPKTEIREEVFFSDELGFIEALNGVYAAMGSPNLYGMNASWGLVDVIGGVYATDNLDLHYQDAANGNLNNVQTEQMTTAIWAGAYNCIANVNNILQNLENVNPSIFVTVNNNILKGEALALRAFLHFDLLRLYLPKFAGSGWNEPIMPYVTTYGKQVTPRIKGSDIIQNILNDINAAEQLLAEDPVRSAYNIDRKVRLNYYAAKALEARVHMWVNNTQAALLAANEVIAAAAVSFPWVSAASIVNEGNMIFSPELIFGLYIDSLRGHTEGKLFNINFNPGLGGGFAMHFGISNDQRQEIFEAGGAGVVDYRNIYGLEEATGTNIFGMPVTTILYRKLHQTGVRDIFGTLQFPDSVARRMPMVRISEMHYIAAECLAAQDPAAAVGHLNLVRQMREVSGTLPDNLSETTIHDEIFKEYRKEFPCEGQLFYYKKRRMDLNYVLPRPQRETELGY
jgi:starch-binding outer membrane protein, SusD/RagB family